MEKDLAKSRAVKTKKARSKGIGAGDIIEDEFGNYRIRAGQLNGVFIARAFPKHSAKSQGLMAEARGSSESEAIAVLKQQLTKREDERTVSRRREARAKTTVPTKEEFLEALQQASLSTAQLSILKVHALAGEDGLGTIEIMNAGGYKSQAAALKSLAKAGMLMADFIGLESYGGDQDGPDSAINVIGFRDTSESDATSRLVMHEELREAVWQTL